MKNIVQMAVTFFILTICINQFAIERCYTTGKNDLLRIQSNPILWQFQTRGTIYSTPLIDNGILYIGSLDSCFYAIDASTGIEKWNYKAHDQIFATPVKYDTILCFESGNVLYGLNLEGKLSWKFKMYDSTILNMHDEWDYYHSSPLLVGNIVYIGTEKGFVFGVDITNGIKVFQCQTPLANHTIETTPVIYDNKIYFGDWDGVFYSYDLSTANLVWQYDTKNDIVYPGWVNAIVTDPVIFQNAVYFGGRSCNLYCLDAQNGTRKWIYRDAGSMWLLGGPTLTDSVLYLGSSYQHVVRAFDSSTGKVIWDKGVEYRVNGKPTIEGEYVYVGTEDNTNTNIGTLCALNKSDGMMKTKLNMNTQIYSTPVISNGVIYFGGSNGFVYAVSQQELFNVPFPKMQLTCPDTLNFGILQKNSNLYTTDIYISNVGDASDSVTITTTISQVKVQPTSLNIAPHDSQKVTFTVDPSPLSIKNYRGYLFFASQKALLLTTTRKCIIFKVETSGGTEMEPTSPNEYSLEQNYPNPFNPSTIIRYQVPITTQVNLRIFDILGREVKTLVDEIKPPGIHFIEWNVANIPTGLYFYQMKAGHYIQMRKMVVCK